MMLTGLGGNSRPLAARVAPIITGITLWAGYPGNEQGEIHEKPAQ
jgi:hypothetical protein